MEIVHLTRESFLSAVETALSALKNNEVIIIPTDTIYGLSGRLHSSDAYKRAMSAKGREKHHYFSWQVPRVEFIAAYIDLSLIPENVEILPFLNAVLPGALTVILPVKQDSLPAHVRHMQTVGFRIPNHPLAHQLALRLNEPLITTSANISGHRYKADLHHISSEFNETIPFLFWDDSIRGDIPSTIISIDMTGLHLIREGHIAFETLQLQFKQYLKH